MMSFIKTFNLKNVKTLKYKKGEGWKDCKAAGVLKFNKKTSLKILKHSTKKFKGTLIFLKILKLPSVGFFRKILKFIV